MYIISIDGGQLQKMKFCQISKTPKPKCVSGHYEQFQFLIFCLQLCTTAQNVISQDYCRICQTKFEAKDAVFREYGTSKN